MNLDLLNNLFLAGGFVTAVVLGMIIIPNILLISYKKQLFDVPDGRKVHKTPVPRLGGLSFFPTILIAMALNVGLRYLSGPSLDVLAIPQTGIELLFIFAGLTMLYLVGEADDLVGVGYKVKFLIQIIASVLMVLTGTWLHSLGGLFGIHEIPSWFGIPLTLVIVVYITNAINLIDGIDGLASGLCCISLAVLSVMLFLRHDYVHALLALTTLGVIIPFWFYNVFGNELQGHKLFMGDAGSLTLGYILSFLVLRLSFPAHTGDDASRDMIIAFSTLLVPLFDVVRVVFHRARKGRNPFLPDKNHFHHKLLRTGMRNRYVLMTIIGIVVFFIGLNTLLTYCVSTTLILLIDVVIWTCLQYWINWRIRVYSHDHPEMAKSYVETYNNTALKEKKR